MVWAGLKNILFPVCFCFIEVHNVVIVIFTRCFPLRSKDVLEKFFPSTSSLLKAVISIQ